MSEYRDFADDFWFYATHADDLIVPRYKIILADESQDFASAEQVLCKKLAEAGARIVMVGDSTQSLYRFRGADSEAFGKLSKGLEDWSHDKEGVVNTISKNFRSKPAILEFAGKKLALKD